MLLVSDLPRVRHHHHFEQGSPPVAAFRFRLTMGFESDTPTGTPRGGTPIPRLCFKALRSENRAAMNDRRQRQRIEQYFDCTRLSVWSAERSRVSSLSPTGSCIDSRFNVPAEGAVGGQREGLDSACASLNWAKMTRQAAGHSQCIFLNRLQRWCAVRLYFVSPDGAASDPCSWSSRRITSATWLAHVAVSIA